MKKILLELKIALLVIKLLNILSILFIYKNDYYLFNDFMQILMNNIYEFCA